MKQIFRELVYIAICGVLAVILVQIGDDMMRMLREQRAERRERIRSRRDHPSSSGPRYE